MTGHEHYEELAALSAGAFLSCQEQMELREHTQVCSDCLRAEREFCELVRLGLPLTEGAIREFLQTAKTKTDRKLRERIILQARLEGVVFSAEVLEPGTAVSVSQRWRQWFYSWFTSLQSTVGPRFKAVPMRKNSFSGRIRH
jgi:hypothetical protein